MVSKIKLTWFDTIFILASKTLSYLWCWNCELWDKFLKAQNDKVVFTFDHEWWSAVGSINSFNRKRLRSKTWLWRYHHWFCFGESSKSSILRRLLIFNLPDTFVHHFAFYFWAFLKKYKICMRPGTLFVFIRLRAIWPKSYQLGSLEKSHRNSDYLQ